MSAEPVSGTQQSVAVLPVGRSLGPRDGGLLFDVRVGDGVVDLDPVTWAVWSLCHGLPGVAGPWTERDVVLQALAAGLPDAEPVLADLRSTDLLTDAPGDDAQAERLARRLRLFQVLPALGNTPDEPAAWALGAPGVPVVHVDDALHDLVVGGHRDADLWTTVSTRAASAAALGIAGPDTDPHRLLERLVGALPLLLAVGAVHLDLAVPA
jgi:hypothetical protein